MVGVRRSPGWIVAGTVAAASVVLSAQASFFNAHDDHTEYDLLDPASHQFHIVYDVTQRQVGATSLLNQTRPGSAGSAIAVSDPRTGRPLTFEYKTGAELMTDGVASNLAPAEHYIRVLLPRPVPEGGEGRARIEKTYLDERSYSTDGPDIVFARSLGIGRNAIVLPAGYGLVASNVAGAVFARADGRIGVSFENANGYAADVQIRARPGAATIPPAAVVDRALESAKTLYELGDPALHEVVVRHEYVDAGPRTRSALGILATDPIVEPQVVDMDTGETLDVVTDEGRPFARLTLALTAPDQSAHLRVAGREIDAAYRVEGGELVWDKILRAPRTTVVLPPGWQVIEVSTPAIVGTRSDGRIAIGVVNGRVEPVAFSVRAVKRAGH